MWQIIAKSNAKPAGAIPGFCSCVFKNLMRLQKLCLSGDNQSRPAVKKACCDVKAFPCFLFHVHSKLPKTSGQSLVRQEGF